MSADVSQSVASLIDTVHQLKDLIVALDRRLPQVERSGEVAIATAAVRLKTEAMKRIAELEIEIAARPSDDGRTTHS
jgi:hypothetical protein